MKIKIKKEKNKRGGKMTVYEMQVRFVSVFYNLLFDAVFLIKLVLFFDQTLQFRSKSTNTVYLK